jgi:hypothetical protein
MANMGYCRMENTYKDLQDCYDNWEYTASESELKYRQYIVSLCQKIITDFSEGEIDEEEDK